MTTETTNQAQEESTTINLSLSDLLIAVQAIQIGAQRGAYRAEEFTQIGGSFERIAAFLEANGAIKRNTSGEAEEASTESTGSEA